MTRSTEGGDSPTFDLINQPWLPARDLDGCSRELSLLETLEQAHRLAGLSGEVPTQVFALTRLLLAVLHGVLDGPRDVGDWEELWAAPSLPAAKIAEYLERHHGRFDLFHHSTPFLQVADLRTAKGDTSELTKLVADIPNGVPFFTTRNGIALELTPAEAARWLVHCQAFDPSGIKSGALGDSRVKSGRGYPIGTAWSGLLGGVLLEGANLKQTLLLNLVARDFDDYARDPGTDRPVWEREPVNAAEEIDGGRAPTGPVDLYTWQSRRIRLFVDDGRVTRVLICNGERLTPQNKQGVEPHTGWRRSPTQEKKLGSPTPVYMPREHDPDRAVWRGLQSLLPGTSSRQGADGASAQAPGIMEWLSYLTTARVIDADAQVQVRAIGMMYGAQSSVTNDIVNDTLTLCAILARRDATELAAVAAACVEAAEAAARCLGNLAGDLTAAAGGDGTGPRSRAMERVYAQLDAPFRQWLLTLRANTDTIEAQVDWHRQVNRVVSGAARELLRQIPPACWEGRFVRGRVLTAAHADARYFADLRAALPFATSVPARSA